VAESRLVQANRLVEQARAEVSAAETGPDQVAVTQAKVAAAEAKVKLAEAAMEQARLNLQYTTIKSVTSGVVGKKSVEPGQIVQPGQPLLALVPLEDIWVTANFKETELRNMRPGQRVSISVDAYARRYWGRVESIAAATGTRFSLLPPENATGNYVKVVQRIPVKIVFDKGQDPDHLLRPGMSVVPTVYLK
jgi:membrane fusion protein (multidrug efflux system)